MVLSFSLCLRFPRKIASRRLLATAAVRKPDTSEWQGVVGLEIHAQIASKSKLFSGSGTTFSAPTNSQVSLFDCAIPGTLPSLNRRCVEAAARTALALHCRLNAVSSFDRKHYFYADLPAGYQITQYFKPIATGGWSEYPIFVPGKDKEPRNFRANITQIQLEQDSGKSFHNAEAGYSLIDLNRAGIGLMEIITEPEFENGEQAASFARELILLLRALAVCDVKMFEGQVRVDANISVRKRGEPLGTRTEVKNISSLKYVAKAVDYEISRQIQLLLEGEHVTNETRGIDFRTGQTYPMRDKEILQDYRFMPEPNLPPLRLFDSEAGQVVPEGQIDLAEIRRNTPELPAERRERYRRELGLNAAQAFVLLAEDGLGDLFDELLSYVESENSTPSVVTNLLMNVLLGTVNEMHQNTAEISVDARKLARFIDMLSDETVPRVVFVKIVDTLCKNPGEIGDPDEYVRKNDWIQVNDLGELRTLCDQVIEKNAANVAKYKSGKQRVINHLVNEVKVLSNEKANLRKVKGILEDVLGKVPEVEKKKKSFKTVPSDDT